ncbi:MAG TPA: hypothetical protein VFS08_14320 [Gemmatimonadaceae bacterium]|nr:hypothetical protein [Gemmatimonadaceae bacterium]
MFPGVRRTEPTYGRTASWASAIPTISFVVVFPTDPVTPTISGR